MKLLLVGHGKMGQLVGTLAPHYDAEVVGVIDPGSPLHGGGLPSGVACCAGVPDFCPEKMLPNRSDNPLPDD